MLSNSKFQSISSLNALLSNSNFHVSDGKGESTNGKKICLPELKIVYPVPLSRILRVSQGSKVCRAGWRRTSLFFYQTIAKPKTPPFLQACFLCKRRLGPDTDIYMYRGDAAFCSVECRYEQIVIDERKEKCSVEVRNMKESSGPANYRQSSGANQSVQAGTVAAA